MPHRSLPELLLYFSRQARANKLITEARCGEEVGDSRGKTRRLIAGDEKESQCRAINSNQFACVVKYLHWDSQ